MCEVELYLKIKNDDKHTDSVGVIEEEKRIMGFLDAGLHMIFPYALRKMPNLEKKKRRKDD